MNFKRNTSASCVDHVFLFYLKFVSNLNEESFIRDSGTSDHFSTVMSILNKPCYPSTNFTDTN